MNKRIILLSLQFAAFALVALTAGQSQAQLSTAARRFTGSACVQVGTTGVLRITPDDGSVYNDMTSLGSNLVVDCPVLSDLGGNSGQAADLWYLDHSTSSINCTFKSEDQFSTAVNQQSLSSTGDDNGYRKLTFTVAVFSGGFSHIRCTIPPRDSSGNASFIVGYAGY